VREKGGEEGRRGRGGGRRAPIARARAVRRRAAPRPARRARRAVDPGRARRGRPMQRTRSRRPPAPPPSAPQRPRLGRRVQGRLGVPQTHVGWAPGAAAGGRGPLRGVRRGALCLVLLRRNRRPRLHLWRVRVVGGGGGGRGGRAHCRVESLESRGARPFLLPPPPRSIPPCSAPRCPQIMAHPLPSRHWSWWPPTPPSPPDPPGLPGGPGDRAGRRRLV